MHQRKGSRNNNGNGTDMYNRTAAGDIEGGGGRGRGRGGGGRGGGLSAGDANANILEQQNNERINDLADHVARLKGLTIDIGNEVREQNSLLDNMGDGFENTRDMLQGSLRRIGTMLEQGGAKHMCYMVAFCVFVMIFLWWLMSYKGQSGA
jgi:blocked early in transport 1